MNIKRLSLILASLVLGVGTSANATDYTSTIEQSLSQAVKSQSVQVSQQLSSALTKSIKVQLEQFLPNSTPDKKTTMLSKTTSQTKQNSTSE